MLCSFLCFPLCVCRRNYPVIMRPAKRRRPSEIHWRSSTELLPSHGAVLHRRAPPLQRAWPAAHWPSLRSRLASGTTHARFHYWMPSRTTTWRSACHRFPSLMSTVSLLPRSGGSFFPAAGEPLLRSAVDTFPRATLPSAPLGAHLYTRARDDGNWEPSSMTMSR
jgi:hypothetical protein